MGKVTPLKIDVNDGRLPLKDKGLDMKDFSSVAELRRDQLEKLAAGFRMLVCWIQFATHPRRGLRNY